MDKIEYGSSPGITLKLTTKHTPTLEGHELFMKHLILTYIKNKDYSQDRLTFFKHKVDIMMMAFVVL